MSEEKDNGGKLKMMTVIMEKGLKQKEGSGIKGKKN